MDLPIRFRWLGVAGIELAAGDQVLVVDPFFTRFPPWKALLGRVQPDRNLIAHRLQRCDNILVSHAHWDHIMDVPEVVRNTGAVAWGDENSCQILAVCGVPREKTKRVYPGDEFVLGHFEIKILETVHKRIPGTAPGQLRPGLQPPLRARDYRLGACYSFLISVGGFRFLTDPGTQPNDALPADLLFVYPGMEPTYYEVLLARVQPRLVVTYHWESLFRPLSKPLRPFWKPPKWAFPPLQRVNLAEFREVIRRISPQTWVLEPEPFRPYNVADTVQEHDTSCRFLFSGLH